MSGSTVPAAAPAPPTTSALPTSDQSHDSPQPQAPAAAAAAAAAQAQPQAQPRPPTAAQAQEAPQLDQAVSELVSGFSSWWGGVSKKLAPAVEQARSNLQQGSQTILAAAKDEISRFEASLEEAQRKAREEQATSASGSALGTGTAGVSSERSASDKGKGRDVSLDELAELEGPDGAAAAQAKPSSPPLVFDADGDVISGGREPNAKEAELEHKVEQGLEQGLARAQALVSNVTKQLGDDPRVQSLSASLSHWASQAGEQLRQRTAATDPTSGEEGAPRSSSDLLTSLSRTLQTSLPHLDWEQSQNLAHKAWERGEEFTKDVTQGVRELAGELVQVTPAHGEQHEPNPAIAASALAAPGIVFDATPVDTPPPATPRSGAKPDPAPASAPAPAPLKSAMKQPAKSAQTPAPAAAGASAPPPAPTSSLLPSAAESKSDAWGLSDDESSSPSPSPAPQAGSKSVSATAASAPIAKPAGGAGEDSDSDWE